jgi:hypothetical protein
MAMVMRLFATVTCSCVPAISAKETKTSIKKFQDPYQETRKIFGFNQPDDKLATLVLRIGIRDG